MQIVVRSGKEEERRRRKKQEKEERRKKEETPGTFLKKTVPASRGTQKSHAYFSGSWTFQKGEEDGRDVGVDANANVHVDENKNCKL